MKVSDSGSSIGGPLNYATTFEEKVLGVKCEVEVVVELSSGNSSVTAGMRQALRSSPACYLTIDTLEALLNCIKATHKNAKLLDDLAEAATDHQLNASVGGATLIIVKPPGKPARFTLTVGLFHREGKLEELSTKEIEAAIQTLSALRKRVLTKVGK